MKESQDAMKDQCGLFGVWGHPDAANLTYLGLYALQHRGQEGAGIATLNGGKIKAHRNMGLVSKIFTKEIFDSLPGNIAIGHVRYSTTGRSELRNVHPLVVNCGLGTIAIAHNGHLTNAGEIRKNLEKEGSIFQTGSDTEVILHLIARSKREKIKDRVIDALSQVEGAYSLLILTEQGIFAVRDPNGYRPLILGKLKEGYVFASETCAFHIMDADYEREINPGEVIFVDENGFLERISTLKENKNGISKCVFEYVYLSRPDSIIFGKNVYEVRKNFGRILAEEANIEADVVIPVPDSGVPAALGYSEVSKIPFELGLIRNHYVGRTFIEPEQSIRDFGVKVKLAPIREVINGKRVVVVDDSLVRGTTAKKIVKMIRNAGAKEVHLRISSPKVVNSCHYGVDTPTRKELLANNYSLSQIQHFVDADGIAFLSLTGMFSQEGLDINSFCVDCFGGK